MTRQKDDEYKMTPTVYGVGYLGIGDYRARKESKGMTKEYVMWTNMLSRCYGKPYRDNPSNPSRYAECTVCEEWHNFQNFAKWCNEQPNFGKPRYSLDKDLTEFGNTIYCPEKCYILSPTVNGVLKIVKRGTTPDLPVGINVHHGQYCANLEGNSFYSRDLDAVTSWYTQKKKDKIFQVLTKHQNEISEAIYQNLLNWAP